MTEITIPMDQPDASFGTIGSRYYGIYRMPGSSRWKQLHDGKRIIFFGSAHEASRAALAKVNSLLFKPIRAQGEATSPDETAADALDVAGWRESKERQRVEDRKVFRGLGKGFVVVKTKGRARA